VGALQDKQLDKEDIFVLKSYLLYNGQVFLAQLYVFLLSGLDVYKYV